MLAMLVLGGLAGCLDNDPLPGGGDTFIAMQADFAEFSTWSNTDVAQQDTGHVAGDRTVYVNALPAADATSFPVGTMIVKTIDWSGGTDIHAMVKRGGDYNPDGALGWEWFELTLSGDTPVIKWRGEAPPAGEQYQQIPGMSQDSGVTVTGDCNTCHGAEAGANDYVHTIPL